MAKLYSSWVAGHSVGIELSPSSYKRQGFGVTTSVESPLQGGPGRAWNYYHIAIPTPVIVEDKRATLHNVHYLFGSQNQAQLIEVIVYDGNDIIEHRHAYKIGDQPANFTPQFGNHTFELDAANGIDVNRDGIRWGIDLTLQFDAPRNVGAEIFFKSFGADFYHNI